MLWQCYLCKKSSIYCRQFQICSEFFSAKYYFYWTVSFITVCNTVWNFYVLRDKYTYEKRTKYNQVKYTWYNFVNMGESDFVRSNIRTILYSGYLILKCLPRPSPFECHNVLPGVYWKMTPSPMQYNSKCIRRFRLGENGRKRLWKWKRFGRSDEARCELGVNSVWVLSKINSTLNRIVFTQFSWFEGTH